MRKTIGIAAIFILIIIGYFITKDSTPSELTREDTLGTERFVDVVSKDITTPDPTVLESNAVAYVYTIAGEANGAVVLNVSFTKNGGYPLLNLALDLNNDGEIAAYDVDGETQEEWVLQNVPAYVIGDTKNNYTIDVVDLDSLQRSTISGVGTFSASNLDGMWVDTENTQTVMFSVESFELNDILGLNVPGNGPDIYRGGGASIGFVRTAHANGSLEDIPDMDIDLDMDIPDLPQSSMECAPTSITNNMLGLAKAYGKEGELPDPQTMIDQLKEDLKFGDEGRDGVLDQNYIDGKNAFMRRYNLPVVTEEIQNPSFEDIADALSEGAVVEMDLAFFDVSGGSPTHVASHVVTLTGISSDGGEFELRGRDSATPDGNESWDFFPKQEGQPQSQMAYPKWKKGATIINKIYIQRWVSVDDAILAGVLPQGAVGSTYPVEMLVIGGNYYPKDQFRVGSHDQEGCSADHYHKDGTAFGLKTKTDTDIVSKGDPAPENCGFGTVPSVPVETIRITWEQQQALAGALSTP